MRERCTSMVEAWVKILIQIKKVLLARSTAIYIYIYISGCKKMLKEEKRAPMGIVESGITMDKIAMDIHVHG